MRSRTAFALLLLCATARAATTVDVGSTVIVPHVKHFGISGISHYYYDRLLLKNLVWRNAGFEPLLFQAIERCDSGLTPTGCVDTNPFTVWPTGFWNGGTYEFILGTAKGRTGPIAQSTAPPVDHSVGTTWTFGDGGTTPAQGDYFIVRKMFPGGAEMGWNVNAVGGATASTEVADQPPGTPGLQCLRISAASAGQSLQLGNAFGAFPPNTFLVLNGTYRISFKAKLIAGTSNINVSVARAATITSQNVPLSSSWNTYNVDFSASETNPTGYAVLSFNVAGSTVLLDDVSLVQTNVDPTNTTAFRDPVIAALRDFSPGILRAHVLDLGQSVDDLVAPPFARLRSEFHASATDKGTNQYGWPEFLQLCEFVGAEPYLILPIASTENDIRNAMEYLAGPLTSPYGAKRAAAGHPAPWTDTFARIQLEYGNESWNPVYLGATLFPADYGLRGNDLFAAARLSPYFNASKFNLILGVQAANPFNSRNTHNASANHDTLAIGPYMATQIDDFATNEQLFGSLFAEASWWSKGSNGFVKQTYDFINATPRPVGFIVYEVNLHTTLGAISQEALDSFTPSVGAGLAVSNHMLNMLREQKIKDQLIFSLAGYKFDRQDGKHALIWGITRDIGVNDRKRPQYLAAKLVNEALSGDLVQTAQSGDNPMWNQPLTNRIQIDNVPFIQTFAFVNGARRAIVAFNLHRTSALDVTFTGANAPRGSVTMKRLTSAALTDNNEDAVNVVTTTQQLSNFDPAVPLTLPPFSMTVLIADGVHGGSDVDGDGKGDLFWRNGSSGDNALWLMNGLSIGSTATLPAVTDTNWKIAGSGDFDGNGKADLIWLHDVSGQVVIWTMNGTSIGTATTVTTVSSAQWKVGAVCDLDGDGKSDVVWTNRSTGETVAWLMNGASISSAAYLTTVADLDWNIAGAGDFDGDGRSDLLWRNVVTGQNVMWMMNGGAIASASYTNTVSDTNYEIAGVGDTDGDHKADVVWWNHATGDVVVWRMNGAAITSAALTGTASDTNWHIEAVGDFNGDGKADLMWRQVTTGDVVGWLLDGTSLLQAGYITRVNGGSWAIGAP